MFLLDLGGLGWKDLLRLSRRGGGQLVGGASRCPLCGDAGGWEGGERPSAVRLRVLALPWESNGKPWGPPPPNEGFSSLFLTFKTFPKRKPVTKLCWAVAHAMSTECRWLFDYSLLEIKLPCFTHRSFEFRRCTGRPLAPEHC